jgi:pilus assembly protein CpaF
MSLLERQLKAAQAAEAAAAAVTEAPEVPAQAPAPVAPAAPAGPAAPSANGTTPKGAEPGTNLPAIIPPAETKSAGPRNASREAMLNEIRILMQGQIIAAFDSLLDGTATDTKTRIEGIVDRVVGENSFAVTKDERNRLVEEMIHEITGFGPLEPLLNDPTITEVMVNGPDHIYIERKGKILKVDSYFLNNEHVLRIIDRIIRPLGRRIDETSPRVDARLPDGSRVNAIIAPLSLIGPVITVRKFSKTPYTVDDLISFGTATPEMFEFLRACVEARLNIFVSGGTGSGKTTFLNVVSSFIPNDERIVTIEDAAELQLRQEHVVTLESRPPNIEGEGEIVIRDLLRNAMHMRPDRVIVGECRSGEALDMLQAMTTGQDGSLSTGHANTPKDMLRRLETMVLMTGYELPLRAIREQIASAVDLIVHTARLKDGSRKVTNITEVYGIEDDEILTQDIFAWQQTGVVDGKIQGHLAPTGIRPTFMGQFARNGVTLPPGEYGIPPEDPAKPVRVQKGRFGLPDSRDLVTPEIIAHGLGRATKAGGMVYVSSVGPVDPETKMVVRGGMKEHCRQAMDNLKARLEEHGSSIDKVVWANWALREAGDFEIFNEEWARVFAAGGPVGQSTMLPPLLRRAGFRVSIGVIAEA